MTGTLRALTRYLLAAALAASLVSCSEEEQPVTLPSLTPSTATPTSTLGLTDEQQIRHLYTDYIAHRYEVPDLDKDDRHEFLAQWTTDPLLSVILDGVAKDEKKRRRFNGEAVPHIFDVTIDGSTAEVDDCSDDSNVSIVNTRTGKNVEKGFGRNWYVASLKRTEDGWRIYAYEMEEKSCVGR